MTLWLLAFHLQMNGPKILDVLFLHLLDPSFKFGLTSYNLGRFVLCCKLSWGSNTVLVSLIPCVTLSQLIPLPDLSFL